MSIRLKIKLANGVSIDTILTPEKAKKAEELKSYRVIRNENNRRFRVYQCGEDKFSELPCLDINKRLQQLTVYVKDLKGLEA